MHQERLGFNDWFKHQFDPDKPGGLVAARVVAVHKGVCEVCDGETTREARMTGRMRHQAQTKLDYPTVGDWVLVKDFDDEYSATIQTVLKRRTVLRRKTAGRTVRYHLIAANIDVVFIMQSIGQGFNLQRLERYLVMASEGGIEPVILLCKRDLLSEAELRQRVGEARERMPGVAVHAFSNTDRTGLAEVEALFRPGGTYCLVGPSGAGKTTLLNNLLGEEDYLFTLPVREKDGKGVHSTTWRELVELDNGAMVVDTPGLRELGNIDAEGGLDETFEDIADLATQCRFADCSHVDTPGCAVAAAVADGSLPEARYRNFIRLMGEAAEQARSALEKRGKDKVSGRFHRSMQSRKPEDQ